METDISGYVIIGTGVAGVGAVEAIRRKDKHGKILLIGDEPHAFYSRPGLGYYLTKEIPENQLFPHDRNYFKKLNVQRAHQTVTAIDPGNHSITLGTGQAIRFDRLLIATGAEAIQPRIPGATLEGVVKLNSLDDARRIFKHARRGKRAVVIGGGITALEIVEGLRAQGMEVHFLLRGDRFWGRVLEKSESRLIEKRLKHEGVHIHYHTEVKAILSKRGRVAGVQTTDNKQTACHLVAYAVGIRPRIGVARDAGIKTDRGILINEYLETNHSDIYAAGDAAQVFDPQTGEAVLNSLWGPARLQGHIAGLNMAGGHLAYEKTVSFNVTRLAGLTTAIIGQVGQAYQEDDVYIVRGESEVWRQIPDAIAFQSHSDVNHLRLMISSNNIVGAMLIGDQSLTQILIEMITKKYNISPIRSQLLENSVPAAELITQYWIDNRKTYAA